MRRDSGLHTSIGRTLRAKRVRYCASALRSSNRRTTRSAMSERIERYAALNDFGSVSITQSAPL
jgi:hypothetical protein